MTVETVENCRICEKNYHVRGATKKFRYIEYNPRTDNSTKFPHEMCGGISVFTTRKSKLERFVYSCVFLRFLERPTSAANLR